MIATTEQRYGAECLVGAWPSGEFAAAWSRLNRTVDGTGSPFTGPAFNAAMWAEFMPSGESLTAVARGRDGAVVGLLPLLRHRPTHQGIGLKEVAFLRNAHTVRNALLVADGDAPTEPVLATLLDALRAVGGWDSLYLNNLPVVQAELVARLAGAHGLATAGIEPGRHLCFIKVCGTFEAFLATRSGDFRRQLRKFRRLADARGKVEIERHTGRDALRAQADTLIELSERSWQGSSLEPNARAADQRFTRRLIDTLPHDELGDLWLLRLGGRPVAALRMLAAPGKRYVHTMHYDPAFKDVAPGNILFEAMMSAAFADGLEEVDCHGDGRLFRRWSTGARAHATLRIFRRAPRGLAFYAGRRLAHWWRNTRASLSAHG